MLSCSAPGHQAQILADEELHSNREKLFGISLGGGTAVVPFAGSARCNESPYWLSAYE